MNTENRLSHGQQPKYLTKYEFGQRLYKLMMAEGWNQSDLARQAELPRDSISVYIRGKSLPTSKSLKKLSDAFGIEPEELLPNSIRVGPSDIGEVTEMRLCDTPPGTAHLRINRTVPIAMALRIVSILEGLAETVVTEQQSSR